MLDRSGLSDVHELKLNGVQTKLVIFHKENYDLSRKCRSKKQTRKVKPDNYLV